VKRSDKNTALAFLALCTLRHSKGGNEKGVEIALLFKRKSLFDLYFTGF